MPQPSRRGACGRPFTIRTLSNHTSESRGASSQRAGVAVSQRRNTFIVAWQLHSCVAGSATPYCLLSDVEPKAPLPSGYDQQVTPDVRAPCRSWPLVFSDCVAGSNPARLGSGRLHPGVYICQGQSEIWGFDPNDLVMFCSTSSFRHSDRKTVPSPCPFELTELQSRRFGTSARAETKCRQTNGTPTGLEEKLRSLLGKKPGDGRGPSYRTLF
jgi:hypothetical protein